LTIFLYQLFIGAFQALMRLAGLFSKKIRLGVEGRSGLMANLDESFNKMTNGRPVAWFHAASLGEFEQGRPVMEKFREEYPDYFILLTFFSPSGYEIRKHYAGADYICYLPIDTYSNAAAFVRIIKPRIVFFIKYEFWFNYLRELRKSGVYIFSFSTIFRPGQVFFKWYGGFYRKLLTYFDHIFVQNEESLRLLKSIQITQCSLAGDTRFDRVSAIAATVKDLPLVASFKNDKMCVVAGSVWGADMNVIIPAVNALPRPIKMIIAPHEIKMEEIEAWRGKLSGSSVLYSEFVKGNQQLEADYLFIDNIGMLSSLYRYGDMAYIGGSFGSGLHNILEAATFGLPVTFGDKGYRKFLEAKDLIQEGGAIAVSDEASLAALINLWSDKDKRTQSGKISKAYVGRQIGATDIVMAAVQEKLNK
jgi:3-deoxy-D-manno-octulosonic-acid transferase